MKLLSLREVAEILSVTPARAAALARENLLPVVRLGRQIRVHPEQLQRFIENGGKALPGGWRRTEREAA